MADDRRRSDAYVYRTLRHDRVPHPPRSPRRDGSAIPTNNERTERGRRSRRDGSIASQNTHGADHEGALARIPEIVGDIPNAPQGSSPEDAITVIRRRPLRPQGPDNQGRTPIEQYDALWAEATQLEADAVWEENTARRADARGLWQEADAAWNRANDLRDAAADMRDVSGALLDAVRDAEDAVRDASDRARVHTRTRIFRGSGVYRGQHFNNNGGGVTIFHE